MGLKSVQVIVLQNGARLPLTSQEFPPQTDSVELKLNLSALKLKEGELQIEVTTGDQSIYHLGKGNVSQQQFRLTYDTRPPLISILSKAHNLNKGGSGLVTYRLNEEAEKTGVLIGDRFFPGFLLDSGFYASLIAYPYNMKEADFVPRVVAIDLAGNERQSGIYYRANNKKCRTRNIKLSDKFLLQKTPEFEPLVPQSSEPVDIFVYVN